MKFDTGASAPTATVKNELTGRRLATVCEEAACPNRHSCYSSGTATYLILGKICTRNCRFCNISSGRPEAPDEAEPERIVRSVQELDLSHVVLTSVTRDDLPDGGSAHFARVIEFIKESFPHINVEALIPDFGGKRECLERIFRAGPDIINHNIETVESLYSEIAPQSSYNRSLQVLRESAQARFLTKSGLLLGLGESETEIIETIEELYSVGVRMLTLGQYLKPGPESVPVKSYIKPEKFIELKELATRIGYSSVQAGPLVRSSYHAAQAYKQSS